MQTLFGPLLILQKLLDEGIIIFNWTPNFTDSDGFVFIEFPPYFYGCRETEGGDGACGSPRGWLKKAANYKFPKTHPMRIQPTLRWTSIRQ